jgi:hypothetical protein
MHPRTLQHLVRRVPRLTPPAPSGPAPPSARPGRRRGCRGRCRSRRGRGEDGTGQGTATDQKVPVPQPLPSPSGSVVRIRCGPAQGEGSQGSANLNRGEPHPCTTAEVSGTSSPSSGSAWTRTSTRNRVRQSIHVRTWAVAVWGHRRDSTSRVGIRPGHRVNRATSPSSSGWSSSGASVVETLLHRRSPPKGGGRWGHRQVIDAVAWRNRIGSPWAARTAAYGVQHAHLWTSTASERQAGPKSSAQPSCFGTKRSRLRAMEAPRQFSLPQPQALARPLTERIEAHGQTGGKTHDHHSAAWRPAGRRRGCVCVVWAARGGPQWVRVVATATIAAGELVRRSDKRDRLSEGQE